MLNKIKQKLQKNISITFNEALELMKLEGADCIELFSIANRVRSKLGNEIDLCSIINAKCGLCPEDCKFCAQSVYNDTDITPYSLISEDEIMDMAFMMQDEGAARFCIVISGKEVEKEDIEKILNSIKRIKKETKLLVCASLGMLTKEFALELKKSGVSRLHHNLETSENFFGNICTTHTYEDKIKTIKIAKEAGLEVCCGGIIGLGESIKDRLELAFKLCELDVDAIPINILAPVKGTKLENIKPISQLEILKTIAVFRLILPDKNIRIAGGRNSSLGDLQCLSLLAGANGLLIGNYLTTTGRMPSDDIKMILALGLIPKGVK